MYYNTIMVTTAEFKKNIELKLPPLPLDVQFFDKIIDNGFLYVDKTGFIARLINSKLTYIEKISKSIAMEEYIMGYPNRDVRYSFLNHLLEEFSPENPRLIDNITEAIMENRVEDMLENMKAIFVAVPYDHFDPAKEASYHSLTHAIFYLILDNIGAEIHTNLGKIDEVIETDRYVYIFEFKMEDAQAAIDQIHQKKYYEKYRIKGKEIVLVGVSFSKEERNIKEWIIKAL